MLMNSADKKKNHFSFQMLLNKTVYRVPYELPEAKREGQIKILWLRK